MRFYLDEDLSPRIAEIARGQDVDVLSSHECGRNGLSDEQQLSAAGKEGRCFVTRDRDHMVALTVHFFETDRPHAGLLIVPSSIPSHLFTLIASGIVDYDRRHPEGISPYTIDFLHPASRDS